MFWEFCQKMFWLKEKALVILNKLNFVRQFISLIILMLLYIDYFKKKHNLILFLKKLLKVNTSI